MKHIKFLLAVALVSVFAISCKETPKAEEVQDEAVEVVEETVEVAVDSTEAVEVVVDSVAVVAE